MGEKTTITIEPMKKEDLDQVLAIEQASFSQPWSRNLFLGEFRSTTVSTLLVARTRMNDRQQVVGYIVFWTVEDEMHILNLAVAEAYRRQGIANKLVLSGIKLAYRKGAKKAFLEVRASNSGAQKLYSSLGFMGSSIRRGYYDLPEEDAVVMTLEQGAVERIMKETK
ncbi:MAG: ribosomal-protein-alanine N-acetyltransferase [Nitrospirae bacterium GWD2_57_9]|nr:MAG: ribosomal-protein-alanine N-acetyltransferase [Nitrospirae bacterium GWD2_57_9]OGW47310.1 MAG: ribosomal-protein-alanine N-acetyltransferase [Nitrospirae bacterium GWC2_57_9]